MSSFIYIGLLVVGIILGVAAQLALKYGMQKANITNFSNERKLTIAKKMFLNVPVILGFTAYGLSMLTWLAVLSKLDLSYAYPMIASGYVFVALGSRALFKEHISKPRWLSLAIIILGVIVIGLS